MRTLILVGGLGTRLRELMKDRPKPMAVVHGRPFLEYLVLQAKKYGLTDLILCTGHRGSAIREFFGNGARWGVTVKYSEEQEPRGTGGAIKLAQELIGDETLLVMNGDSFFDIDLHRLIEHHGERESLATIALARVGSSGRFGTVKVDDAGRIVAFAEKNEKAGFGLVNAGIYVFSKKILDSIPIGRAVSLEHEIFPGLVGRAFYGLPFSSYFIDIGIPEDCLAVQADPNKLLAAVE